MEGVGGRGEEGGTWSFLHALLLFDMRHSLKIDGEQSLQALELI